MPFIHTRGVPTSRIWIIFERPFSTDVDKGFMCSGGMGYAIQKMLEEGGLQISDCFICSRFPDTDTPLAAISLNMETYKPPLIIAVGQAAAFYLPELRSQGAQKTYKTQLNKYVGSLMHCEMLQWDHWMMPFYDPSDLMADWTERNVSTYIDIGKLKDELEYWKQHGTVQPLRSRTLLSHDMDTDEVLSYLDAFRSAPYLSEDIETVYPREKSRFKGVHPGMPITFGVATSADFGISFNIFRKSPAESRAVWTAFDRLHSGGATIIGQNFFNFDSLFYNMLGLEVDRSRFQDTLLRHHILWPELPHKLQFLTRQYTRQPYYKDEGKGWSLNKLDDLRHYNCLDVTVTYEVFEGQEEEFKQRPHLIGAVA
jgi:uracil-DNA glycosylase